jgi:aminomethyltransferase
MGKHTALHSLHAEKSAKFVDVSDYCLPLHYGSATAEHKAVRDSAGMFDLTHVGLLDLHGEQAESMLRLLLTNDAGKLADGQGMYSCLCHENGGVIDHLLVFRLQPNHYRLFIDAERQQKDISWLEARRPAGVVMEQVTGVSHLAVQGPDALHLFNKAVKQMGLPLQPEKLARFGSLQHGNWFVTRTGYTGEDGVEIVLPENQAVDLWQSLEQQGVAVAGLAARDSLRIEAGFARYGQDLDEEHSPVESGVAAAVDISDESRNFIGREVIEDHKLFGGPTQQIGIVLDGQGDLSSGQSIELVGKSIGKLTSATFSPTRAVSLALARVIKTFTGACDVNVQDRLQSAHISSIPFVPHGQARE